MEVFMEWVTKIFGEGGDLAAIASAAGLGGGVSSAAVALAFRGFIMRFLVRTVMTAVLTGAGFLVLLHTLGFQIVPKDEMAAASVPPYLNGLVTPESNQYASVEEDKTRKRVVYVKSPWRR